MPPFPRSQKEDYAATDRNGNIDDDNMIRHSVVGADRMQRFEPADAPAVEGIARSKSFIQEFVASKGPPQIVILMMLLALGLGSTIGVVR